MNLSFTAVALLKHVVTFTGEQMLSAEGKETPALRRLNNEDSGQRRFFMREAERVMKDPQAELNASVEDYNAFLTLKRGTFRKKLEDETPDEFEKSEAAFLNADSEIKTRLEEVTEKNSRLSKMKFELTLTDKTVAFLKKYFALYGEDVGYMTGDDEAVEELNSVMV